MSFLHGCKYHFGNRFEFGKLEEEIEEPIQFRYHPIYYRFHRHIPRRRLWMRW
ncbi:MAG: hypothetical protein FWB80_03685 [Defluviitaleaceae bacterium]|nr:hypothetical protein [Defluviitaleaceae bacterium]